MIPSRARGAAGGGRRGETSEGAGAGPGLLPPLKVGAGVAGPGGARRGCRRRAGPGAAPQGGRRRSGQGGLVGSRAGAPGTLPGGGGRQPCLSGSLRLEGAADRNRGAELPLLQGYGRETGQAGTELVEGQEGGREGGREGKREEEAAARSGSRAEPRCAVVSLRSALCSASPLPSLPIPRPPPRRPPTFNPFPPPRGWRLRRALARPRPLRFPTPSVAESDRGREKGGGRGGWSCGAEYRPRAAPGTRLCTHTRAHTPSCAEPSRASPRLPPPLLLARPISVTASHPAGFAAAAAAFLPLPGPRRPFPSCSGWAAPELPRLGGGGQSPLPGPYRRGGGCGAAGKAKGSPSAPIARPAL
ncbi:translation initiation factor IF-2-like [Falco biarmicus]|uniref:translation initiation factor IF-2-like n=1 Tax=Falco biarmicus TaxID=345155 RepID=UPI0024BD05A7|nr:translation initiation factor IF-2-like [Falco biarmicus]